MPNTATKHYAIDLQNPEGNTPLHIAAKRGVPGIVKICLQAGADFNIKNNQGQKASDIATGEVKQLLLDQELNQAKAFPGPGPVFFNSATINKDDDAATTPSASNYSPK